MTIPQTAPIPTYVPPVAQSPVARACPACTRDWGAGISCQFCEQMGGMPVGVRVSSPGKRLGGYLLEGVLLVFTLGIGWLIWSMFTWGSGQSPAKKILGMKVIDTRTSQPATWGKMFLREFLGKLVGGVVNFCTLGIMTFMLLWDGKKQEVWDKIAGTVVVDDPHQQLA